MGFSSSTVSIGNNTKKSDYDLVLDNTKALKDEAITLNGAKTFQSNTVFNATATFNSNLNVTGTATVVSFPSKRITSANYLHGDSISQDTIFDKLAPFIPNTGDAIVASGGDGANVISRIERTSATVITLYIMGSGGTVGTTTITDGEAGTRNVSIAW